MAKFGVMVQFQGKRPKVVNVDGSATVRTALQEAQAKGHLPKGDIEKYAGKTTLGGKRAELSTRIGTNALIALSENVAGGSR